MDKNNIFLKTYFLFFLLIGFLCFTQVTPSNTRLYQLNTLKGSVLSFVESSENFVYHVGTSNSNEIGFDGLSSKSIGLDDLFILKSNASNGSNVWLKTFNAGINGVIVPKYLYIGPSENLYVFGQFKGSITVGSKTINSVNNNDSFLMKIDRNGNAVWVDYFANGINTTYPKVKCVTDGLDTFLIFNQNHLVRMDDTNGDVLYDKTYDYVEWKSIALQNSNLFVAGYSNTTNLVFGTETIPNIYTGFVLRGDKNANFNASVKTSGSTSGSNVDDIEFSGDGNLLMTGFSAGSVNLITESNTVSYTYNTNTNFSTAKIYYNISKINPSFTNVYFFRTSTDLGISSSNLGSTRSYSKIIPYGTTGNFRILLKFAHNSTSSADLNITNPNSTTYTIPANQIRNYRSLLSCDALGNYLAGAQPVLYDGFLCASGSNYVKTASVGKTYTTNSYNATTSALLWSKQKSASIAGSLGGQFIKHLNSAKSDVFFTTLVEGKANIFGRQVNNSSSIVSRYMARLGADGLPKWFAKFHQDSGVGELNVSSDFACVDKDDNFLVMCNTAGTSSTFFDATGNSVDFTQNSSVSSKAIIKLDKNGNLLWSKQILPSAPAIVNAAIATDNNGDVYIVGTSTQNLNIDGHIISTVSNSSIIPPEGSMFLIKFSATGNYLYSKVYKDYSTYSLHPVFDAQNNLYVFSEPIFLTANNNTFDSVTIPITDLALLMLKFDSSGNVVWGKNFFENNPNLYYAWPIDVVFDGTDFIVMGNLYATKSSSNFTGLDLINIPKIYPNVSYIPFFAKVSTNGSVIWQKPLHANISNTGNYTNIDIDNNKNIYMYCYVKDKINIDNTEYQFDAAKGNKILLKLNTHGNYQYSKVIDFGQSTYPLVDVIGNDQVNISAHTTENNVFNYSVNNNLGSNLYIATLGNLTQKYLTPEKNYLELSNITMENNPNNSNNYSFDLINNVNWTATTDQSWLSLSFLNLTGKNVSQNTISGNGDAKITLTAETNTTGASRSATVMVSGIGVDSKSIIVTQTGNLGTKESKTLIMMLYPNPTSDILNIQSQEKITKAEIYDFTGKLLLQTTVIDKKINVNTLSKGTYFIKLHTEKGIVNSKFIKN